WAWDWEARIQALHAAVVRGTYRPTPLRPATIPKADGTRRRIYVATVTDRVLLRSVHDVLEDALDHRFTDSAFGYRPGRGVVDAVSEVIRLRGWGYRWVLDADIRDCFPSLDHALLLTFLRKRVMDQDLLDLIALWLPYGRPRSVRRSQGPQGISLGAVTSPLFCNVYLHEMDTTLRRAGLEEVRYADDFVVLCRTRQERDEALETVKRSLEPLMLQLHPTKTRLNSFEEGFTFLGVSFKDRKYWYSRNGIQVQASDMGESFPLEIDGYPFEAR
ncbi:MAG: reverse transcriptase domain-containing protein, partial [Armatimonadota bacterium]|nr:reverse transcriptase domain-containing protein [Armatimonadota bacterium]